MIRMRGAVSAFELTLCATRMPASDMYGFPCCREFKMESGAAAYLAFYLNLTRMFLDDAVAHCQPQSRTPALPFAHCQLGGEEGIVNTLHMLESDARSSV